MKVVLTIAGSDSSGGAGVQADLRAISASGGFGAVVIAAVTAQSTRGVVLARVLPVALVAAQLDAVFGDMPVAAVKSGMLGSARVVRAVADRLRHYAPAFYVLDPVLLSTSGHRLLDEGAVEALRKELFPLATLLTPTAHEAAALTGRRVRSLRDAEDAGRRLLDDGPRAVLVKGGHLREGRATDVLVTRRGAHVIPGEWIDTPHTHGTGCTYAAAIATHLARGRTLREAVTLAKAYVTEAIRGGFPVGHGAGPTDHFFYLRRADLAAWVRRLRLRGSREE
ncbi:MAG: bifunctional hydroxymethylpyrimidine kinase/phosphomethylpyrimidine kinase [Dehalococcoidia bacterium]|nr:bifunctional hydroxymethylpyrimidine kinase/phosphomethylpyrimidine kinase [Dehalococcoidia bacterium]